MKADAQFDVNRPVTIVTLVLHASFAAFVLLTAPALVGAFITELQLTPQQAGYIISADMAGMGFATIPALFWLKRINWRKVAFASLLSSAFCHLLSAGAESYESLLAVRLFAGLFAGTSMSVCLASIGLTLHKERNFGFWVTGQLILGSAGLALMPHVIPQWGVKSVYLCAAASFVLLSALVKFLPQSSVDQSQGSEDSKVEMNRHWLTLCVLGVAAIYCFYVALSGVWAYMERIGDASDMSAESLGYYLSIASLAGIAGAISASCLGERWGRNKPVTLGFISILIALILLLGTVQPVRYLLAASAFKYAWSFILPFMLAALSALDRSGRVIVITNIFIGGGLATGPALAANLISGENYGAVICFGIAGMMLSFFFVLPLLVSRRAPKEARTEDPIGSV